MRKLGQIFLLSGLALIFLFASTAYSAEPAGEVLAVKKDVFRIRGESRDNAEAQMDLLMKDTVETDKQSRTKLYFKDDSILNLGELSKVEVEKYIYSPEKQRSKSIYRLIDGSIKVVVGRSDLEVHTAATVASARGTAFLMKKRVLPSEECKSIPEKEAKTGASVSPAAIVIEDQHRRCVETCVYVLDSKVEFKLKKDAKTDKTKKDNVTINQGEIYCLIGDNLVEKEMDAQLMSEWKDELPVYASAIPQKGALPAFAPEPPAIFDVSGDSPVDQEPEPIPEIDSPVEVEVYFPPPVN